MKVEYRVLLYPGIYFEGLPMSRRIVLERIVLDVLAGGLTCANGG
jgi:hypothetical protein